MLNRRKFIGLTTAALTATGYAQKAFAGPNAYSLDTANAAKAGTQAYTYPEFDLYRIPFSYAGSFTTIEKKDDTNYSRLSVNTVRRSAIPYKWQAAWANNLFGIALRKDGEDMPFVPTATPWSLTLMGASASAAIAFIDKDTLAVRTENCALQIIPVRAFSWVYPPVQGTLKIYDNQPNHYYDIQSLDGKSLVPGGSNAMDTDQPIPLVSSESAENIIVIRILTEETDYTPLHLNWPELINQRREEVEAWMRSAPEVLPQHGAAAKTGWYLFWNLQVSPWKNYSRQSVLSSKKSMDMMWSWDICFNALALVKANHRLAWDQLFAVLDKQRPNGLLPDTVSDLESGFGFNKPPIWGFTIMKMLDDTPAEYWHRYIAEAYPKVARFTKWWFRNRNLNAKGICAYMHGNDSGWDNATIFDERLPVESPDLTAFLVLQTEALYFMAGKLGREKEAAGWLYRSKQQLGLFIKTFVTPAGLIYRTLTVNGPVQHTSTSLLTRIPLILGKRLPAALLKNLVDELKTENIFLTPNGVASEALNSRKYEPNGYWRGPVWAPSTYLIVEGLIACGEKALAVTIAKRFCDMVSRQATFNENYNAVTGEGQYDSGLTWTASDFLLMAEWLANA